MKPYQSMFVDVDDKAGLMVDRRSLASRPEVIDSLHMEDPVHQSQGQAEASTSGNSKHAPQVTTSMHFR